jgi:uncharacterized protein (DUF433 family)
MKLLNRSRPEVKGRTTNWSNERARRYNQFMAIALTESLNKIVWIDPKGQNGEPCFYGTRVPIKTLFDYLKGGHTLEDFLAGFPPVTREQAEVVLDASQGSLYETPSELVKRLGTALVRLDQLTELEENWDSYGAEPIASTAIITAHKLIAEAILHFLDKHGVRAIPYDIGTLPAGGVQVVWKGQHAELEVDISPEGRSGYLQIVNPGNNPTYEEGNDVSLDTIIALISQTLHQ